MKTNESKGKIVDCAYAIAHNLLKIAELWEEAENDIMEMADNYKAGDDAVDKELRQWMLKEYPFGTVDIGDLAWKVVIWADEMNVEGGDE